MLLPMLLRTLISGAPAQGETTRRELSRVAVGVPGEIVTSLGIKPAPPSSPSGRQPPTSSALPTTQEDEGKGELSVEPGSIEEEQEAEDEFDRQEEVYRLAREKADKAERENGKDGVKIGFFLHTPFPSSEIYRYVQR